MASTIGTTEGQGRLARVATVGGGGEFAQYVAAITAPYRVLGTRTFTVAGTALALSDAGAGGAVPAGATHAIISVKATPGTVDTDQDPDGIRVRQDNTSPTSSIGLFLPGGTAMEVAPITTSGGVDTSALGQVRLIRAQATSMEVTVEFRSYSG